MFSLYGETGRLFKGAMEDLWQVGAVQAVTRTRAVGAPGTQAVLRQASAPVAAHALHAPAHARTDSALAAYQRTEQPLASRHPLHRVQDVMSHAVITIPADMPLAQAWRYLSEQGVGQVPVVNARGLVVGLLSRADLLRPDRLPQPNASPLVWRALLAQPVASIMWTPVPAVAKETDLRHVARVMLDTHLPGLPVVDEDDALLGFISRSDILRAVVHDPPLDLWS